MKKVSLLEQCIGAIKKDILSGSYEVGDKYLSEGELCTRFGVSRTTVREALRAVQAIGFLELKPGRGSFVSICDENQVSSGAAGSIFEKEDSFLELTEVRIGIEPTVAKYAAERATEDEIFMLYGILSVFENAVRSNDIIGMIAADEKLHNYVAVCAHNDVYIKLYEQMSLVLKECKGRLFSVKNNGESAIGEHREIVAAIAAHDCDKAWSAMERHIQNISENIKTIASKKG